MRQRQGLSLSLACIAVIAVASSANGREPGAGSGLRAVIVTDHLQTTFERAVAAAEAAGAHAMHLFPPDAFIARFPAGAVRAAFAGLPVDIVEKPGAGAGKGLDIVVETALDALLGGARPAPSAGALGWEGPIEDVLLRVPPEVIRATTPPGPRLGSAREIADRGANQNSEFMLGSVLVNIVFPESMSGSESWTDEEMAAAMTDLSLGIQQYLERAAWTQLSFTYNYKNFMRVPVSIEPIESDMGTDQIWIGEAVANIGYEGGAYYGTHQLNNATRNTFKTDWVFTAFVADMSAHYTANPPRPDPGCWGGSGYVAYAYLGGPYMVIPYPACRYGPGLGYGRVFIHEMSHIFWALDEYESALTSCTERSGYLNVPTLNTLYHPEVCRAEPVPCIMQTANPPFTAPLPICETTQGQVGLASTEIGAITVPSIYAAAPEIEFIILPGLEIDTLLPGEDYPLAVRVRNPAVSNKNPQQDPAYRIDYAAPLRSGEISIDGAPFEALRPSSGAWDSPREDIATELFGSRFQPGFNTLTIRVRNRFDLEAIETKDVFVVGIKYFFVSAEPGVGTVRLSWTTPQEVFGATFSIMRADHTSGEEARLLGTVTEPESQGADRRSYVYADTLVQAGHQYRYRIIGAFGIDFRGEHYEYEFPSTEIAVTSPIPIVAGGFLSNLLPNPSDGYVAFTVEVPETWSRVEDSRAPSPGNAGSLVSSATLVRTPLEVAVYNVLGQRLRTIYSGSRFGGVLSLDWDGADDRGVIVPPGVYFLSVTAGGRKDVRKIVVLR